MSQLQSVPSATSDGSPPEVRVWLRRNGGGCKVRVEGAAAAEWLRDQLTGYRCTDARPVAGSPYAVFVATLGLGATYERFQERVESLDHVRLMLDPA